MAPEQKPGRSSQDWQTPPEFIEAVKRLLGITDFVIDLAASPENAQADRFYTEEQDALQQVWPTDGWAWLNPPYRHIRPWVAKARLEAVVGGAKIAMLLPAGVGANWWRDFVHEYAEVFFVNGRLTFVGAGGPYPKDVALLLYGKNGKKSVAMPSYHVWDWRRGHAY